ncbi:MAG: hypothetical protein II126_00075, partial [Erysipelotrichaceae bacterium]|nr:hypothetical protein [Erysipelotrichaceae bacterium]
MTESRQHRMLVKLYDILQAAVMVYGPLDEQQIEEIISLYYGKKYEKYYPYIQEMLELLCQNDMEKDENGRYSIIPFEIVDEISHMIEMASGDQDVFLPQKKFESADRFISFADPFDPDNLPSMRRLYDYIYSLNIPEQLKDEFYHVGVIVAIQMADPEDYLEIISHKSTEFVDEDKLVQIIDDMVQEFPRGFFNGNSLSELKNLHEEKRLEDEMDRIQPKEKPSERGHSYRECMELTDDLSGRRILQYLDSESLMEFLVNGEQAYLVVNRFDDEKLLLCIMSREELEDNYHLIVNADNYPDMMMRTSGIFVALNDQGELAEPIEDELPYEEDDPRHSIIRYYCMKRYSAVEDQQDIDRLFGVLSDLSAIDSEDNYQILADKDSWAEG